MGIDGIVTGVVLVLIGPPAIRRTPGEQDRDNKQQKQNPRFPHRSPLEMNSTKLDTAWRGEDADGVLPRGIVRTRTLSAAAGGPPPNPRGGEERRPLAQMGHRRAWWGPSCGGGRLAPRQSTDDATAPPLPTASVMSRSGAGGALCPDHEWCRMPDQTWCISVARSPVNQHRFRARPPGGKPFGLSLRAFAGFRWKVLRAFAAARATRGYQANALRARSIRRAFADPLFRTTIRRFRRALAAPPSRTRRPRERGGSRT